MSELKQVWEIIKDHQCAELQMVQGPALAVWNHQQANIDELQNRIDCLQEKFSDLKEDIDLQEYLYQGDPYNQGWNSALSMIKQKLEKLIGGD